MIKIDYRPHPECKSKEVTFGAICVKCGKCGRLFDKDGFMIDDVDIKRPPTCHEILDRLKEHYEECEDFWNKLIENDADWFVVEKASTRVSAVDECINLVRSVMEG